MVSVDDVDRGDSTVTCPSCSDALIPKKGDLVSHHFSHKSKNGGGGGGGCAETALHRYCKEFLASRSRLGKCMEIPDPPTAGYERIWSIAGLNEHNRRSIKMQILSSKTELRFPEQNRFADIGMKAGLYLSGSESRGIPSRIVGAAFPIAVEICVTNPKGPDYIRDLASDGLAGLEIVINGQMVNERMERYPARTWESVVNTLLMPSFRNKRWLRLPDLLTEPEDDLDLFTRWR